MASIYDLSWGETSFLAKLKLFFKSRKQEGKKIRQSFNRYVLAEGCSALSSTYYSIAGTAFIQLRDVASDIFGWRAWSVPFRLAAWFLTWLPLGAWCYWRMLALSNRVVKLIGYDGMSADQCDIRQSILRRQGLYYEAEKCIHAALAKNPEKAHTRGLLYVGLAEIYRHRGDWQNAEVVVGAALIAAREAERQDPRQAARIYRRCADITDFIDQDNQFRGDQLRRKARELAEAADVKDQLLKLR